MSDARAGRRRAPQADSVRLVYFLYLVGVVFPLLTLVGLIVAYVNRDKPGGWIDTHYTYQIRTFWIGMLYYLIAGALTALTLFLLSPTMLVLMVWFIVRTAVGFRDHGRGQPRRNPKTWLVCLTGPNGVGTKAERGIV